jgi:aryl-alcohol dehydrogenase-like predicted oxidoreductase
VAYSPLAHGFLTGKIRSIDDLADNDWRKTNPRFNGENFRRNLRIADEVDAVPRGRFEVVGSTGRCPSR